MDGQPQPAMDHLGGSFTPSGAAPPQQGTDQFGGTFTPNGATATPPAAPPQPEEGTFAKALRYMRAMSTANPMAPSPDMAMGFLKTVAGYAGHLTNIAGDSYGNDLTDIPEYMREHPGASPMEAAKAITSRQWESKSVKQNRTRLREAGDWLHEQSKMPGWFEPGGLSQHIGGVGADILAWEGLGGVLGLSAPAVAEVGEAGAAAEPIEAQLKRAGDMVTVLKKYPMLEKAATVGMRVLHTVASNPESISRNAMISGTLGAVESEGDPEATVKSAVLGGTIGGFAEAASKVADAHLSAKAAEEKAVQQAGVNLPEVAGMSKEDAIAALSKPLPPPRATPVPERPVPEEAPPTPVTAAEPPSRKDFIAENAPEPPQRPTAPEALPPLPRAPKRTVLDDPDLPAKPEGGPEQAAEPEPLEPTPVGMEEPTAPDRFTLDFPSAEERLRNMQAETARSVTTDSGAVTAKHLENIQNVIQSREFARMTPIQRTQLLDQRTKLMRYLREGRNPSDVLNEVNDFGQAAAYLRAAPDMAEKRWNTISSGEYESINKQLKALEGKPLDADAVLKQSELKDRLERMFSSQEFKGVASSGRRSLYRTMRQNADVLQGVDDAISKSFSGAEQSGEFNAGTLQTNWRNLVAKNTPEQMKAVLGEERYNAMNDFVNQVAMEPKLEAAGQAAQDAQFKEVMNNYKDAVKAAKTKDEMLAAAQKAETTAKQQQFNQEWQDRIDQWKNDVNQATDAHQAQQDELDRTFEKEKAAHDAAREQRQKEQYQRGQEFAAAKKEFGNQQREYQKAINDLKDQHDRMTQDYKDAKADAKNQDKATQDRLDAEFKAKDDAWKQQKKQLDATNRANVSLYRKAESARNKALTQLQKTPQQELAEANQEKLSKLLKITPIAGAEYLAHFLPPGISTAVRVAVPTAVVLGKMLAHPTTARLLTQFMKWGGDVGAYRAVISDSLRRNYEAQER